MRALFLPPGALIEAQDNRPLVSANVAGTVAVTVVFSNATRFRRRIVIWSPSGVRRTLEPPATRVATSGVEPATLDAVVAPNNAVYGIVEYPFDGAYIGSARHLFRWHNNSHEEIVLQNCGGSDRFTPMTVGPDGRIALAGRYDSFNDEILPPTKAIVLEGLACRSLGDGWITAINGPFAAGYRGPLANRAARAPEEHLVAVRWTNTSARELGPGIALGINPHGIAVGADGPINDSSRHPKPFVWFANGSKHFLPARAGIAYAINKSGRTIVGTTFDDRGQSAVRWREGRMERLDDFLTPHSGWHLVVAYGMTTDGAIYGLGEINGRHAVFVLSVSENRRASGKS